ncbi:hypothetical protein [Mariniflexile sp.]|uniref:hypothetical protein n=1 Tax=Mariniflexile sp. TaxID=1979402 RepID=UPI00356B1ED7
MKRTLLFVSILLLSLNNYAQTSICGSIVNDTFDTAGLLPSEWIEYNTTSQVTIDNGRLKLNHTTDKPAIYRDFNPVNENFSYAFEVD